MIDTTKSPSSNRHDAANTFESRTFFLDADEKVLPIDHDRYVAWARREIAAPEFAGRRLILVDWYVRLAGARPEAIVNETCSWIVFDVAGFSDLHAAHGIDANAAPSAAQWAQIRSLVFDGAAGADDRVRRHYAAPNDRSVEEEAERSSSGTASPTCFVPTELARKSGVEPMLGFDRDVHRDRGLPKRLLNILRDTLRSPELSLGGFAFLLNFPWEMLQSPLFEGMGSMPHREAVMYCTRAAFGDAAIMLIAFWTVAAVGRGRGWLMQPTPVPMGAFVLIGLLITIAIEMLATSGRWLEGWTYSSHMPMLPGTNVGLVPILQWIVLPLLAVLLTRRQLRERVASK